MSDESARIKNAESSKFEDHHINYSYITAPRTLDARLEALDRELDRVEYVSLTDAIAHMNYGGTLVMEAMSKEPSRKFKVQVLCDVWGNPPVPGEIVTRKIKKKLVDRAGRKLRSNAVNAMKRQGSFEKRYIEKREFVIDEKGCIECGYEDAGWLLSTHGIHYESREGLGGHRELSSGPSKAPDGSLRHIHYWRYAEAPPWVYDKLPNLTETKTKTKRGLPPADPDDNPPIAEA